MKVNVHVIYVLMFLGVVIGVTISGAIVGTQIRASLSFYELAGLSSENYNPSERIGNGNDIVDFLSNPNNYTSKVYLELNRAQLRDWGYPQPILFYIGVAMMFTSIYLALRLRKIHASKALKTIIAVSLGFIFIYSMVFESSPFSFINRIILFIRGYHL
ncbi:hypothetical protein AB6A23_19295 [Paenibacillus tarimensis]